MADAVPCFTVGRAGTGISAAVERAVEPLVSLRTNWATAPRERRGEKRRWNPRTEWRSQRKIDRTRSGLPAQPAICGPVATRITVMRVTAARDLEKSTAQTPVHEPDESERGGIRGMILGGALVAVLALGALGYFYFDRDGGREVASVPQAPSPESKPESKDVAVAAPAAGAGCRAPITAASTGGRARAIRATGDRSLRRPRNAGCVRDHTPGTSGTLKPPPGAEKLRLKRRHRQAAPRSRVPGNRLARAPHNRLTERRASASREHRSTASRKRTRNRSRERRARLARAPRTASRERRQPPRESAAPACESAAHRLARARAPCESAGTGARAPRNRRVRRSR